MRLTPWEKIIPDVLPEVSQAPKPMVRSHIISAAGKFFTETGIWKQTLDPAKLRERKNTIELLPERGTRIVSISSVFDLTKSQQISRELYHSDSDVLTFLRTYAEDRMMQITAAVKPTRSSKGLPESMYEDWGMAIAYGAIASLKAMRGREWEDMAGAQARLALFLDYIAEAKGKVARGGSSETQFMKPRWIG